MPWEIAQYGIAALAVGGLIYVVDRWVNKRDGDGELSAVIKNNTQAGGRVEDRPLSGVGDRGPGTPYYHYPA
jgi:hypothetical protein